MEEKSPLGRGSSRVMRSEKAARKRQLAEAFDVPLPNVDALHFGENSTASESLSDLLRRDPKWVIAIEERFKFMVLGKSKAGTGSSLRVHVFCPMLKEKRDAVWQIAERWKLGVHAAGWEPKRFVVVHVTPKSKPPARILGLKAGVPAIASQPLAYDPSIDMEPRLVVAMLDLPSDSDISALVLRFGGECELVWLNDKNALAVFVDPARAATALRRLEHGSAYHGAVSMPQSGGVQAPAAIGGSVWGAGRGGNPWKRAVAPEADSWGSDWPSGGDEGLPAWRRNEGNPPLLLSPNPWDALGAEAPQETAGESKGSCRVRASLHGEPSGVDLVDVGEGQEVDNWEEACE
ncbi:hypothetical protein HPP92_020386 [Vanilla planifolia]|uniref:NFXL1 RRM-like domain-containing protein n=1 Tax=Vanilla planifolia TaxID=51239 RepID=A0A835UJT9_VANPL|nr:hypothetical protein HPP92_020386 [Vanilla planifolia]